MNSGGRRETMHVNHYRERGLKKYGLTKGHPGRGSNPGPPASKYIALSNTLCRLLTIKPKLQAIKTIGLWIFFQHGILEIAVTIHKYKQSFVLFKMLTAV